MYLACRNEGIIHCPKDGSELLAKKKTFEVNIFKFFLKGEPISKFWDAANQNTVSLCSTICNVYASWKFFTCPTPHPPWKFLPFNPPPPLPRNFHWPSLGGRILSGTTQSISRNKRTTNEPKPGALIFLFSTAGLQECRSDSFTCLNFIVIWPRDCGSAGAIVLKPFNIHFCRPTRTQGVSKSKT